MVHIMGVRRSDYPPIEKSLRPKVELHATFAGLCVIVTIFWIMMLRLSGATHYSWHDWFYAPAICAVPSVLRLIHLAYVWWCRRQRAQKIAPMSHA